jgi:hypothetical protein
MPQDATIAGVKGLSTKLSAIINSLLVHVA